MHGSGRQLLPGDETSQVGTQTTAPTQIGGDTLPDMVTGRERPEHPVGALGETYPELEVAAAVAVA